MTKSTLPVSEEQLSKLLLTLENDLDALGWDRPARMYLVRGSYDDPRFELFAELVGHPCDVLQRMYDEGMRVPNDSLGLGLATEGWRHLTVEELEERLPGQFQQIREYSRQVLPDATDEELRKAMNKAWGDTISHMPRVSQLPDTMRVEVRNIFAVFRDGVSSGVIRDRDGEPQVMDIQGPDSGYQGRVPEFMLKTLRHQRPEDED